MPKSKIKFGLINEAIRATDHVHGEEARLGGSVWPTIVVEDTINGKRRKTWKKFQPEPEYQRKATETSACVSFSGNNTVEYLSNWLMSLDSNFKNYLENLKLIKNGLANFSDRRTAKGSGTDPNSGNTIRAVDDYIRNFLFCPEDLWPFTDSMDIVEYYKPMPAEVADYGKKVSPFFGINTKYLNIFGGVSSAQDIWDSLSFSPVWSSVDGGNYTQAQQYTHRITVREAVYGDYFEIHDNYLNQFVQLPWNYNFATCKIMRIEPKPLADFIQVGNSILFLAKNSGLSGQYVGYGNGDIAKELNKGSYPKPRETRDSLPPNFAGTLIIQK